MLNKLKMHYSEKVNPLWDTVDKVYGALNAASSAQLTGNRVKELFINEGLNGNELSRAMNMLSLEDGVYRKKAVMGDSDGGAFVYLPNDELAGYVEMAFEEIDCATSNEPEYTRGMNLNAFKDYLVDGGMSELFIEAAISRLKNGKVDSLAVLEDRLYEKAAEVKEA